MRVTCFFDDGVLVPMIDRRLVQFQGTDVLPAPPVAFIYEHFKQAVLANMKGAGQIPDLDFDRTENSRNMAVLESGPGKEWLERELARDLVSGIDDRHDNLALQ